MDNADDRSERKKKRIAKDAAYWAEHLARQRENKIPKSTQVPPHARVGNTLRDVLKQMGVLSQVRRRRLHRAWAEALGHHRPDLCATRIVKLSNGVLTVEVDSGTRMHELNVFRKRFIIATLNRILANDPLIIEIHFRLGNFPPLPPPLPPDTNVP